MPEKVNIGVIGAGRIGRMHAENLAFRIPDAHVPAVSDIIPEAAEGCATACNIPKAHDDYRRILDDPEVDAILICSSTDTHTRFIIEAAQAGKHIFCEKPIDFDLKVIDQALEAVRQAGVKLMIGFNRRFDPGIRNARDLVASGKLGVPHLVRITSRDPKAPPIEYVKVSGGLFYDMTIHDFDMCRYIIGQEATEVYAVGGCLVDPAIGQVGDIDTAMITLTYESGAYCSIDNSRQAVYGYDQRVEVFCSEGCVIVGNQTPYNNTVLTKESVSEPLPQYFFIERYTEAYLEEMRLFIRSVRDDSEPAVTGRDGKIPVVMAKAANESLAAGQPVKIELDP